MGYIQELEVREAVTRTLSLDSTALTVHGERREVNQDAVFHRTDRTPSGQRAGLYLVCDGLGRGSTGEVASRLAVETVTAHLGRLFTTVEPVSNNGSTQPSFNTLGAWIRAAIVEANSKIRPYAQVHSREAGSVGTTITLALIYEGIAYIANVGDSRAYAWRSHQVTQLTQDHSMVAKLAEAGVIDKMQMIAHPNRHVILRALGIADTVEVDLFQWQLEPGDKLLLCSDGLWSAFPDEAELAQWLGRASASADLCGQLVNGAYQRDGSDDISAVVVTVA